MRLFNKVFKIFRNDGIEVDLKAEGVNPQTDKECEEVIKKWVKETNASPDFEDIVADEYTYKNK